MIKLAVQIILVIFILAYISDPGILDDVLDIKDDIVDTSIDAVDSIDINKIKDRAKEILE